MANKSRLHIPRPTARPGDEPDFSYLDLSPAGAVDKPSVAARVRDIEYLSSGLVRVLDEDHTAKGPWNPDLDPEKLQIALRWMLLNRVFDKRMWQIQRQGRISFYMEALGEEAISIAQGMALRHGDMCFPSYRNQGLFMYRGMKLVDMMCQCLSNTRDMCKGRQLPIMYHSKSGNVFSISGNLATQYPHAVGWAMASAIKGEDNIAASWVGDGSTAEADFHHALTFAAIYQAPVILNVVNNQWAISSFQGTAGGDRRAFAARGLMESVAKFANLIIASIEATFNSAIIAVNLLNKAASFLPGVEIAPIKRLKQHLINEGHWSDAKHDALVDELTDEVLAAWKEAQKYGTMNEGPFLNPETMFDDVYADPPRRLESQRRRMLEIEQNGGEQ